MDIKKFLILPVLLLLFFVSAHAAEAKKPCYIAEGTYNEADKTYTVDVFLDTDDYLAAGTFGMAFDENIKPIWHDGDVDGENVGYLQVDNNYFTFLEPAPFEEARPTLMNKNYMIVMWGLNETDALNPVRGKLHLGTVTVKNVELNEESGYPDNWPEKPFYLLNWYDTDFSGEDLFTRTDEHYEDSKPLNEDFWRNTSAEERQTLGINAPEGYYQGFVFDTQGNSEQVDIDFVFKSDIEYPSMVITGRVECYNPNNAVRIAAYKDGLAEYAYGADITGYAIYADGKVIYDYKIKVPESGKYTIVYEKQSHLTYVTEVTAEEKTNKIADTLKLICGDINADGYIKYPDRYCLIRFLNRQVSDEIYPDAFNASDLNGDGLINLFDLNILKANLDKTYN